MLALGQDLTVGGHDIIKPSKLTIVANPLFVLRVSKTLMYQPKCQRFEVLLGLCRPQLTVQFTYGKFT